jgi:hypothetical protein
MPPSPPERPGWGILSLLFHLVVIALFIVFSGPTARERQVDFIVLSSPRDSGDGPQAVDMPGGFLGDQGSGSGGRGGRGGRVDTTSAIRIPFDPSNVQPLGLVAARPTGLGGDSVGGEGPIGTGRVLGPEYGDGRLWVWATEAGLGVVGPSETAELHVARVEDAVREKLRAFIQDMPRDSFALAPPPDWTTELDGRTWGVDQQWIYLGDIKIPTMLLALLPLPQGGNYEQAQRAAELAYMRQDIIQAARRAETAADFKRYIEEIRKRKDAERALVKGEKRDTITP